MWPEPGFTKGEAIDYYANVAPAILPHLRGRALTRVRFPNGVAEKHFYEKRAPSHTPDWVHTETIVMSREGPMDFVVCDDLATLTWLAQLAALELHPSLALVDDFDSPTVVVFDLDPGAPADVIDCCRVGLRLRDMFAGLGLECFPKTSGSKGMQVYLPLNSGADYEQTKGFAHAVAQTLEKDDPKRVHLQDEEGAPQGEGLRRLEPECAREDHRRRLLAAPPRPADGLDPARLGGGRGGCRRR